MNLPDARSTNTPSWPYLLGLVIVRPPGGGERVP